MSGDLLSHGVYVVAVVLIMTGLYTLFSTGNLIKRMIGMALFQAAAGLFYIALGKVFGGTSAILLPKDSPYRDGVSASLDPAYVAAHGVDGVVYSNPLPHVLILTAIVVGVATLAIGLAIAVRVRETYGAVELSDIARIDREAIYNNRQIGGDASE
jgi:multicomponent Na+:H+ antiporter subunit C